MPRDTDPSHEAENAEQDDAGTQAQSLADEALGRVGDPSEDSERGGSSNVAGVTPDDVPDLVDKMEQMVTSGHIDMGAYRGEPAHDDEPDTFGADPDEIEEADPIDHDR